MDMYEGVVTDNDDPNKWKRVRVRIHNLHDASIPDDQLPWALPIVSAAYGYDGQNAPIGVPTVGTSLLIVVVGGDVSNPIYLGAICHAGVLTADEKENYPNRVGFVFGSTKFLLDREGPLKLEHGGSTITVGADGSISVSSPGTVQISAAQILLN